MKKILICTGGTGGHIFPVIALTEYLKKKNLVKVESHGDDQDRTSHQKN